MNELAKEKNPPYIYGGKISRKRERKDLLYLTGRKN
jgi:hypothetical protein